MNTLLASMQTNDSHTENGCVTNSSSLNLCVDLFFQIGAMRGQEKSRLINVFTKAFGEDPLTAMRILFWVRDVRGGAGERQIFKDIVRYLAINRTEVIRKNIHLISEYGRWDDLFVFFGTPLEKDALQLISKGLEEKNGLLAKWLPRPNISSREGKKNAFIIRKFLGLSPKDYRKLIVNLSNTVEQLMCSNMWDKIEYSKLPSKAMSDLMKAFSKHDCERFGLYLQSLEKGETKINTGAIYPYDVCKNMRLGMTKGANLQWDNLPNFIGDNKERMLPMVDVSGSMESSVGNNSNITCYDVAISLGLYISERNVGPFKDAFITFTSSPTLQYLKGSLSERYAQMRGPVGYDTNIEKAFRMLLSKAIEGKVQEYDMPTMIIVLSDMEFNTSTVRGFSNQQMVEKLYNDAGYKIPKLVYWNIQSRNDSNKPVRFDKNGVCLVSGFSPSILTNILSGKDMTPYNMMMSIIGSPRYSEITI